MINNREIPKWYKTWQQFFYLVLYEETVAELLPFDQMKQSM